MAIVTLDGYGRPRQLEKEFRQTLERMLHNELGKQARLTSMTRAAYERKDHDDLVVVEENDNEQY